MQNWLILLPEISLLSFFPISFLVNRYRSSKTSKTFFTLSKFSLLSSIFFTLIFYNQSVAPDLLLNNQYSTMFKLLLYAAALVWFYLSSKWFLNKNRTSYNYYSIAMLMVFLFGILISAQNLKVLLFCIPLLCCLTYKLILQHWDEERVSHVARNYLYFSMLFILCLYLGVLCLRYYAGSFSAITIKNWLQSQAVIAPEVYISAVLITMVLLFMMSAAPFHLWFVDTLSLSILPVCGFLSIIPPLAYLSALIFLTNGTFLPLYHNLMPLLHTVAILSLFIGSLSTNEENNIRRLFAFSTIYNLGFMLLGVLSFKSGAIVSSFVYTIIYVMAMTGIYTVFLGLKSKGDYLSDISDITGMSDTRPYLSAAFAVFIISIIGVPPMLGFWGRLSLADTLVLEERWLDAVLLLCALVIIANTFIQIIRKIYFKPSMIHFDRTDKAIYICLFVNLLLAMIIILNPSYMLKYAENILSGGL